MRKTLIFISILIAILIISVAPPLYSHNVVDAAATDNPSMDDIHNEAVPNKLPCSCLANHFLRGAGDWNDDWGQTFAQDISYRTAQSFIPKQALLTHIELYLKYESGDLSATDVTIWLVDSTYAIEDTTASGAPLPSTSVFTKTVPATTLNLASDYSWRMISVPFQTLDIGRTYYIVIQSSEAIIRWAGVSGNHYPDGGRSTQQEADGISDVEDMRFRTYGIDRKLTSDQGNFADDWDINSVQGIYYRTAQSFIPRYEKLMQVSLKLYRESGDPTDTGLTVSIVDSTYDISATTAQEAPNPLESQIVVSRTIFAPGLSIGQENATWVDLQLPATLTVGSTYYIVAKADSASPQIRWLTAGNNAYPDGGRSTSQDIDGVSDNEDMWFKTYSNHVDLAPDQGDFEDNWSLVATQGISYATAQSFMPTESRLDRVQLKLFRETGDASTTKITLWLVDSSYPISETTAQGAPVPTLDHIMREVSINAPALNEGSDHASWITFDFTPLTVKPGATYFIVVQSDSSSPQMRWLEAGSNPYSNGGRSTGQEDNGISSINDMKFRVYGMHPAVVGEQGDHGNSWSVNANQGVYYTTAQSFIPRRHHMAAVSLKMYREAGDIGNANITISIARPGYPISTTTVQGAPEPTFSNLVSTKTIGAQMLGIGSEGASWITIWYHNYLELVPGSTYYIIVSADVSSPSIRWIEAGSNPYPDGGRSTSQEDSGVSTTTDMEFRTFSDQHYWEAFDEGDGSDTWTVNANQGIYYTTAQSFVPQQPSVTSVALKMYRETEARNTNITLYLVDSSYPISDTTAQGAPTPQTGSIITQSTIRAAAIPYSSDQASWVRFDFIRLGGVTPGNTYYIVVNADANDPVIRWVGSSGNPYPDGGRSTGQESSGLSSTEDMKFRTYYYVTPYNPIIIKHNEDLHFTEGDSNAGNILISASDDNAYKYFIFHDDELVRNEWWRSGTDITHYVGDLPAGSHAILFAFMDAGGFITAYIIQVTVDPQDTSTDTTTSEDTTGASSSSLPFNLPGFEAYYVASIILLIPINRKLKTNKID